MAREALRAGEWGAVSVRPVTQAGMEARAHFRELDGRRVQVARRGSTEDEARARLVAELQRRGQRPRVLGTGFTGEHLFGELAGEYLQLLLSAPYSAGTKANIRLLVDGRILTSALAKTPLCEVKVSTIAHLYRSMADVPGQACNVLAELRKICDLGVENDVWGSNPARMFKPPRRRAPRAVEVPDEERLAQLHAAVLAYGNRENRHGPAPSTLLADVLDVVLGTSARIGEALGVRWMDVDLDAMVPTVSIRGTVVERSGTPKFYQPFPKTVAGERGIPIPPFLVATLRRRHAVRSRGQQFVFETRTGRPNGPQDVHRALRLVREWAEIPDDMVPHALRRYVATTVSEAIDLDTAAQTLGHRRSTITERHYIRRVLIAPDARDALEASVPWALRDVAGPVTPPERGK